MDNCPYCGAPGSFDEAVDGCCYVCGMVLPQSTISSATSPAAVDEEAAVPEQLATAAPAAPTPSSPGDNSQMVTVDVGTDPPAIQLIKPRNLAPEYARRVTAAWQATKSPFQNPQETLNSSSGTSADPDNLQIGTRSLQNVAETGEQRPDYELTEVIGQGNMGTVWSARQASLDREVAIKIPKHTAGGSTIGRKMFISEVVVTGQLDHPNIVPIYDLARDQDGHLFYAMKRVDGRPWDDVIHEEGRTRQDNLEILMKVCDAVRFAHDRGVIHRDIKPQNIMIGQYGEVSVMDWGIALRLDRAGVRMANVAKLSPAGTPAYMAPEMATANPGELGPHTDVYLLGAVLYEILTGQPPHPPPSDSHDRMVQQNACLLIAARNVISPMEETGELVDIAYRAMATDFTQRYQSVDEFQTAIRSYFSHAESIALTDSGYGHLANAEQLRNGVYEDYAKARFAFGEAVELWPENFRARNGLAQAIRANASAALTRGDYALGLSLLDENDADNADLLKDLRRAKRRQGRNKFVAVASAAIAATSLLLALVISLYSLDKTQKANAETADALNKLEKTTGTLEQVENKIATIEGSLKTAEGELESRQSDLEKKQIELGALSGQLESKNEELKKSEGDLAKAQDDAKRAESLVVDARAKAEQADYRSDLRLAAEYIDQNAFDNARQILAKYQANPLRDREWNLLDHLAEHPAASRFKIEGAPRIESVAVSPDQKWMAAGAADNNVYVWRRGEASKPPMVLAHVAPVSAVAFSSDSSTLAGAAGNEVHFWSLATGKSAGPPLKYESDLLSVTFHPQQPDVVLTSSKDSKVQVWSRSKPGPPAIRFGHLQGAVWKARFSPDGSQIVSAGEDGTVRIWHRGSIDSQPLGAHNGPVYAAEFTPDGKYVVSGGRDRRLLVWKVPAESGEAPKLVVQRLQGEVDEAGPTVHALGEHSAEIRSISISPDGKIAFSASNDNSVKVWKFNQDVLHGKLLKTLRGHGGWVRSCASLADGREVISGSHDGSVFDWNWQNYDFPDVLRPASDEGLSDLRFTSAASTADGKWLANTAENGAVVMWDMHEPLNADGKILVEGHDWQTTTAAYFDGGNRLLTTGGDNSAVIWDVRLGSQLVRLGGWNASLGTGWRGVAAVSHDGRWVATASTVDGKPDKRAIAKMWDTQTGRQVAALDRGGASSDNTEVPDATAIAFSPDDKTLFVGDQFGNGFLFNTADGQRTAFKPHGRKITAAAFLPDGSLLTASTDSSVIQWSLPPKSAAPLNVRAFKHNGRVVAMAVSDDGRRIVTAADTEDKSATLRLWNAETGEMLAHATQEQIDRVQGGQRQTDERTTVRSVTLHPTEPHALITVFDPNAASEQSCRVCQWNWEQPDASHAIQPLGSKQSDTSFAVYSPERNGMILTVGGRGARLREANRTLMSYRPQPSTWSVSFAPNNELLAVAGGDGSVKFWRLDQASNRWLPDRKLMDVHRGHVNSVAFHPSRSDILLTAGDDTAKIWKLVDNQWQSATLARPDQAGVRQAVFSASATGGPPDILTASNDGKVRLWTEDGNFTGECSAGAQPAPLSCVAGSPDGLWIVAGSGTNAEVWSRADLAKPFLSLKGHSADITSITFSPDSKRLFTASKDRSIKLWDANAWTANANDLRELLTLEEHNGDVTSVTIFGTEKTPALLSAGTDGHAILWPTNKWTP